MGAKGEEALGRLFESGKNQGFRARALHLLARLPNGEKYIANALKDPNKDIRVLGIRSARMSGHDMTKVLPALAFDPSSQVRRECALALYQLKGEAAANIWADLASQHTGNDRWYLEALGIGASDNDDASFKAFASKYPKKLNTDGGRDIIWRSRSSHAIDHIVNILKDPDFPQDEKPRFYRALDFHKGDKKEAALIQLLSLN